MGARIEESRVVHLLSSQNDTSGAGEALSGLPPHEAAAIVMSLLDKPLSSDPARNHPFKLFLVQVPFTCLSVLSPLHLTASTLSPTVWPHALEKCSNTGTSRAILQARTGATYLIGAG